MCNFVGGAILWRDSTDGHWGFGRCHFLDDDVLLTVHFHQVLQAPKTIITWYMVKCQIRALICSYGAPVSNDQMAIDNAEDLYNVPGIGIVSREEAWTPYSPHHKASALTNQVPCPHKCLWHAFYPPVRQQSGKIIITDKRKKKCKIAECENDEVVNSNVTDINHCLENEWKWNKSASKLSKMIQGKR